MLHVCGFVRALCVGGHVQQPAAAALPLKNAGGSVGGGKSYTSLRFTPQPEQQ